MTPDQQDLLIMAHRSHLGARVLLQSGLWGFAASRSYYCMFYVAEAILEGERLSFSKHGAVIAAFGREFVQKEKVPREFHRYLSDAQELRFDGDYGSPADVSREQAEESVRRAGEFLKLAERLLGPLPPEALANV